MNKKNYVSLTVLALLAALMVLCGAEQVKAAEASAVTVADVDYESLYMKVYKNGNSVVYYSTDKKKNYNEVEGMTYTDSSGESYIEMDISFASATSNVTIYLKGDKNTEVVDVTFPKLSSAFKAKFDKASGDFDFSGEEDASSFKWRKSTDYNWHEVSFNATDPSHIQFLKDIDSLRFKGGKIIIRTSQVKGTDADNMGERPGKEISVSIPKRSNAPSVKLNIARFTFNTRDTMEYFDTTKNAWVSCDKNMTLSELAPEVLYNGSAGSDKILKIRIAQTEKQTYSQTAFVKIPAQPAPPSLGNAGTDITCSISEGVTTLVFTKASGENVYEYCVVKPGAEFDFTKASWKKVKNTKEIKLKQKAAPTGTKIYFRIAGANENLSKKTEMVLPSAYVMTTLVY